MLPMRLSPEEHGTSSVLNPDKKKTDMEAIAISISRCREHQRPPPTAHRMFVLNYCMSQRSGISVPAITNLICPLQAVLRACKCDLHCFTQSEGKDLTSGFCFSSEVAPYKFVLLNISSHLISSPKGPCSCSMAS